MTDEEFYRHALEVLQREFGAEGLARFVRLSRSGGGDYTHDGEQWLSNRSLHEARQSISASRHFEK